MVNRNVLESMTAEQVMQLLQEVKERRRAAIARANDAINGYEKAVKARDDKIQELRDNLGKQLANTEDRAAELIAAMLKADVDGDAAGQDKVKDTLTQLEGQRARLNARLELLKGKPPRCDDEYEAMNAAVAQSQKVEEQCREDINTIREFCEKVIQPWVQITMELHHSGEAVSRFFLDRARSHYDSEC